jgi:hypothetical protein
MRETEKLDIAKLLDFDTVATELAGRLDFQDRTLGDKLGAKVAVEPGGVALFQNETVAAKFGTKRGGDIEPTDSA